MPVVLVVDDSYEVARRVSESLEQENFQVLGPVDNGPEALRRFEEERPQALVLDVNMPGMNGIDLTRAVRAKDPHCPIIIFTSHVEESIYEQCRTAGATDVLSKAKDADRIADVLRRALAGMGVGNSS